MKIPEEYTTLETAAPGQGVVQKIFAYFFSTIFHPLFIPVIAVACLAFVLQGYFVGMSVTDKRMILVRVAVNTIFFPFVTILLLKGLGFIKSIFLKSRRERIIPYVAANIFYFWVFLVFHNQPEVPLIVTSFMLGIFLASSVGLVANSFFKISMHALGMGALAGLLLVMIFTGYPDGIFLPMMIVLALTGLVCTSRLMISDHSYFDISSGLLIGLLCQAIAAFFIVSV